MLIEYLETAALALISGLKIELVEKKCDESSEWVVVMGAAGAVGQFGVQVLIAPSLKRINLMSVPACETLRLQSTGFLLSI
jgi:NADPH:quinone reductase-like Zn-dependent oxidoreductase